MTRRALIGVAALALMTAIAAAGYQVSGLTMVVEAELGTRTATIGDLARDGVVSNRHRAPSHGLGMILLI
jgi:hypothetical protein